MEFPQTQKFARSSVPKFYRWLGILGLFIAALFILDSSPGSVTAQPRTPRQHLESAWQAASATGHFTYQTQVKQTTHPTARLDNAGRHPQTEYFEVNGTVDRNAETMHLRLHSAATGREGLALKVEQGQAYGRLNNDTSWTEIDNPSDIFAPGGDPLGFLVAAEHVEPFGENPSPMSDAQHPLPQAYTFTLNGPRYAAYMRQQLVASLQQQGKLPAGVNVGLAEQYVDMDARGQLWLDAVGLPVRQVIHLAFAPAPGQLDWVEAEITTTFSDWAAEGSTQLTGGLFPRLWGMKFHEIIQYAETGFLQKTRFLSIPLFLVCALLFGLLYLLLRYRRSSKVAALFSLAIISSMVLSPLLHARQVSAFIGEQTDRQLAQEQAQATQRRAASTQAESSGATFDPLVNPLAAADAAGLGRESAALVPNTVLAQKRLTLPFTQSTCNYATNLDCDNDGLSNDVERFKLGTDPENPDTDGDFISDRLEVEGFVYNATRWYLDPRNPDSNGDSLLDGLECPEMKDIDDNGALNTSFSPGSCINRDSATGDTTPDVFDYDNDGDGVPDTVDGSPFELLGDPATGLTNNELRFNLNFTGTNQSIFVDFELRPTDPDHLWYTGNVVDWPANDTAGQWTRVHTNTLADYLNETGDSRLYNGDIRMTPLLEMEITYDASNPSAGLPITPTMSSGDITDYSDLSWLDTAALAEMGISANEGNTADRMYLWLPLEVVRDEVGNTPVAWRAQMRYRPETGLTDLGNNSTVRVLWLLDGLLDSCNATEGYARECTADHPENWETRTSILQIYPDSFYVTGLNVREDHGGELALIAQPTGVGSAHYDDYLWHLADSLQSAFLKAQQKPDGNRFQISDISTYAATWNLSGLSVNTYTLNDQTDLMAVTSTHNNDVLNSAFGSAAVEQMATLLYVNQEIVRTATLGDTGTQFNDTNLLSLDLTQSPLLTNGSLRWAPFRYQGDAQWDTTDLESYLRAVGAGLESVFTLSELQSLSGDSALSAVEAETMRQGAVRMAQSYYLALFAGVGISLAIDDESLGGDPLGDFTRTGEIASAVVENLLTQIQRYYAGQSDLASLTDADVSLASSLAAGLARSPATILDALGQVVLGQADSILAQALQSLTHAYKTASVNPSNFTDNASLLSLGYASIAASFDAWVGVGYSAILGGLGISTLVWSYQNFIGATFVAKLKIELSNASGLVKTLKLSMYSLKVMAVVSFVTTAAILWTAFFVMSDSSNALERNAALAQTIAATVTALIVAIISVLPGGLLITAVLGLIDALAAAICALVGVEAGSDVDTWVCGGISGVITRIIGYLIYDQYILADLEDDDRLQIAFHQPNIVPKVGGGVIAGNQVDLSATITNTISLNSPTGIGSALTAAMSDLDPRLQTSTFTYTLQSSETDHHNDLPSGIITWVNHRAVFNASGVGALNRVGINQPAQLYLSESFNLPALECWGFIVQICNFERYKDTYHTNLGNDFVFDVLPPTFDSFYSLSSRDGKSYRLKWDGSFPLLLDADGDGLRSQAAGGPDPDDHTWDSDGDGLSDFWELQNSFDPNHWDPDGDGLSDYWEAFHGLSPYRTDSDGDGLTDDAEFFHTLATHPYQPDSSAWRGGWEFIYDYSGSTALRTWVSADPTDYDSDDDAISDNRERIYGYHPNVPSILNILALDAGVENDVVAPGATIAYTATVKNELDNRVVNGLLQAEFPVDTVQETQVIGSIYPNMAAALAGTVTAPNVSASQVSSMTVRAGAVIDPSAVNQAFVLNLDEARGATLFHDATSARHDFTCRNGCPTAHDGYLEFDGGSYIGSPHHADYNSDSFSVAIWFKPTVLAGILYRDFKDLHINLGSGFIQAEYEPGGATVYLYSGANSVVVNQWQHVLVTYDHLAQTLRLYLNGQLVDSRSGVAPPVRDDNDINFGISYTGQIDYASLYNYAVSQAEVEAMFNNLTFYANFEQAGCGNWRDTLSNKLFTCAASPQTPSVGTGILRDGIFLGHAYGYANLNDSIPFAAGDHAFSIAFWYKINAVVGDFRQSAFHILSLDAATNDLNIYFLDDPTTGSTGLVMESGDPMTEAWQAPHAERIGKWEHVVITYDRFGKSNVYLNGQFYSDNPLSADGDFNNLQTLTNLRVGYQDRFSHTLYNGIVDYTLPGYLDEVRLYNKALNATEIVELYNNTARTLDLRFDEPPGQTAFHDQSPNDALIRCTSATCPESGIPGRANQALRFNGDNYLELGDPEAFHQSFTVMAWLKPDQSNANMGVLGTQNAAGDDVVWLGLLGGKAQILGTPGYVVGTTPLQAEQWYHVAWEYEYVEETGVSTSTVYINGLLEGTVTGRPRYSSSGVPVYFGTYYPTSNDFRGLIDNLVIVREALTEAEIQAVMHEAPNLTLHLDEELGATAFVDDSPNRNNAGCTTCPVAGSKGQMREAPIFDGVDDVLEITDDPSLDFENSFSVALWVKPDNWYNNRHTAFVAKGDGANGNQANYYFGKWVDGDQELKLSFYNGGWVDIRDNSGVTYQDGQWIHLVLSVDTAANEVAFYRNGQLLSRQSHNFGAKPMSTNNAPLAIGGYLNNSQFFGGNLDEVMIYQNALNALEVRDLYAYQAAWYDTTYQQRILIDADDPLVSLNFDGAYLPHQPTILAFAASDPSTLDVAAVAVTITAPDNSTITLSPDPSEKAFAFTPNGAGQYTVQITVTDSVGHTASDVAIVTVDETPPTITVDNTLLAASHSVTTSLSLFGTVGDNASGVATDTLTLDLQDWQGASVNGAQRFTTDGTNWQGAYPISVPPYGHYTLQAAVADTVGNVTQSSFGPLALDSYGPSVDLAQSGYLITQTGTILAGTVSETPYPVEGKKLHLHFEEPAGATTFADSARNYLAATCSSCPTAGQPGHNGLALQFDGDATLSIGESSDLALSDGTLMAWVKPTWSAGTNGYNPAILAMGDESETHYSWHLRDDYSGMAMGNGTSVITVSHSFTPSAWVHVAVAMDQGVWTGYVNGVAVGTISQALGAPTDRPLQIGSSTGSAEFFSGLIDELAIYDRVLDAATIYAIANPLDTPIATAQIRFRHAENGAAGENDGDWVDLSLDTPGQPYSTWSYAMPAREGPHKIDLKATDALGNHTYIPNAWGGDIDLVAPQIDLRYDRIDDSHARLRCRAYDYNITATNWLCPASGQTAEQEDAAWFVDLFGTITKTTALRSDYATIELHGQPRVTTNQTVTACDAFDHCTTETITTPNGLLLNAVAILAPTHSTVITGVAPLEISGIARNLTDGPTTSLTVTANGVPIYTWSGSEMEFTWSTTWTPPATGTYRFEAIATNAAATPTTDPAETVITVVEGPPVATYTLSLTEVGAGRVDLNPSGGMYPDRTVVSLEAIPAVGWQFAGWSGALTGMANPATLQMDANIVVTATFTQIPTYTLQVSYAGNGLGTVDMRPSGGTYLRGTVVTLTATSAAGHFFAGWTGDLVRADTPITITMDSDKAITATFMETTNAIIYRLFLPIVQLGQAVVLHVAPSEVVTEDP